MHKKEEWEFPTPLSSYYIVQYLFPVSSSILVLLILPLERIRHVHAAAEAAVLAAVTIAADVCPPRIILRGIHPHAEFTRTLLPLMLAARISVPLTMPFASPSNSYS